MIKIKFNHFQYPVRVWVFFNCSQSEIISHITTKKYPVKLSDLVDDVDKHEEEMGKAYMFKPGNFLIWLKSEPNNPRTKAELHHEIFHCVYRIREFIGAPVLSEDTEEDWAYMISWITETIYKKYETIKR